MDKIVTEIVVRIDDHPIYSGSKLGASVALQNAYTKYVNEGRGEPTVRVTERKVNYDLPVADQVTETDITL